LHDHNVIQHWRQSWDNTNHIQRHAVIVELANNFEHHAMKYHERMLSCDEVASC